jgi:hypothetical protein
MSPTNRTTLFFVAHELAADQRRDVLHVGVVGLRFVALELHDERTRDRMGHAIVSDPRGIFYARYREDVDMALAQFRRCEQRYRSHRDALAFAASKLPRQPADSPHKAA